MLKRNKLFLILVLCGALFTACKKDGFTGLSDSPADVPVTVTNVYDYRPNPTIKASKAENKISITLEIPASSGRTIKEISKVAAAAGGNFTVIRDSSTVKSTGLYSNTPVTVNGTTYTFTTTFDEYKTKTNTTTTPTSNALLSRDFYFLLTLDNGQIIYPQSVKVWVVD